MKPVSLDFAKELMNFSPEGVTSFGESQLKGAVAAYNMLARNNIAYLADEVGMGKTYIALGVMGLLRHINPKARVLVLAPRENIQRKWMKELGNFVLHNWLVEDNRFKALNGKPVYAPIHCNSMGEFGAFSRLNDQRDPFLRMTMFSIATRQPESRKRYRTFFRETMPWLDISIMSSSDPREFRDGYGRALNALVPDFDLVIVDEAHNLKHGFGYNVSNRNRVLGLALGHPDGKTSECDWYRPHAKRVLLLSATPFEYDYADIYRQLDVLGFAGAKVVNSGGTDPRPISLLDDPDSRDQHTELIRRFLLRRVTHLTIAGEKHSKNMYRREWRKGGLSEHDMPMAMTETKQRLVVGLIQKKIAEVLGDKRFNNCFQIGMLSSFESFLESTKQNRRPSTANEPESDEDKERKERVYEGEQDATTKERQGIDRHSLATVVDSYYRKFGETLPHPKLNATAESLAPCFETGEKSLVFVRRVATVSELKTKLDAKFDSWIRSRMDQELPTLKSEINDIFSVYTEEQTRGREHYLDRDSAGVDDGTKRAGEEDSGGRDTFFAWFFRGTGPKGILSGAAFHKNRLQSASAVYANFFEDDYVAFLLGHPEDTFATLAARAAMTEPELTRELSRRAFSYFSRTTNRKEGYPRRNIFNAYQSAAIALLGEHCPELHEKAVVILGERFALHTGAADEPPVGFPSPRESIGLTTFFTELTKRTKLRQALWPRSTAKEFRVEFRDRELRRELISSLARLGRSFIDLYILAIRQLGGFKLSADNRTQEPASTLITSFLDNLEQQADSEGFDAYYELSNAATAFDTILKVNFPDLPHAKLSTVSDHYSNTLQKQVPVGRMAGGVNKRLVRQFRMPGFPLVLATTDVLQEGEDLHTFCRKVLHYGISWTPSAMEQRTGRVDRIDGLAHRTLDHKASRAKPDELIQVYYPHLTDTIEVLQVRHVLWRLYKFLVMIHQPRQKKDRDQSRINVLEEVLKKSDEIPQLEGRLDSAFPVRPDWLTGPLGKGNVIRPDIQSLEHRLAALWTQLKADLLIDDSLTSKDSKRHYVGTVSIRNGSIVRAGAPEGGGPVRRQSFRLELRSQVVGGAALLRATSPVGVLDLEDDQEMLDALYSLQYNTGKSKVCADYDAKTKRHLVTIEGDRLFELDTTQPQEIEDLIVNTAEVADRMERELLECDADAIRVDGTAEANAHE